MTSELAQILQTQLTAVQGTKRAMAEIFVDLSHKQRELEGEMIANGKSFESVNDQSETLIKALVSFTDGLKTLVERTIQVMSDLLKWVTSPHAEFGRTGQREGAPHFMNTNVIMNYVLGFIGYDNKV